MNTAPLGSSLETRREFRVFALVNGVFSPVELVDPKWRGPLTSPSENDLVRAVEQFGQPHISYSILPMIVKRRVTNELR
jgi:hypothetical protein